MGGRGGDRARRARRRPRPRGDRRRRARGRRGLRLVGPAAPPRSRSRAGSRASASRSPRSLRPSPPLRVPFPRWKHVRSALHRRNGTRRSDPSRLVRHTGARAPRHQIDADERMETAPGQGEGMFEPFPPASSVSCSPGMFVPSDARRSSTRPSGRAPSASRCLPASAAIGGRPAAPQRDALRYLAFVRSGLSMGHAVFTSYSAIALAGLPIVGARHVVVMSSGENGHRRGDVTRIARTVEISTISTGGLPTTTIEFSLIQLARRAPLATALVATDAASASRARVLRRSRRSGHSGPSTSGCCRTTGAAGSTRCSRATSDADTPLETMSRMVIEEFDSPNRCSSTGGGSGSRSKRVRTSSGPITRWLPRRTVAASIWGMVSSNPSTPCWPRRLRRTRSVHR